MSLGHFFPVMHELALAIAAVTSSIISPCTIRLHRGGRIVAADAAIASRASLVVRFSDLKGVHRVVRPCMQYAPTCRLGQ
mgnify:FL=1